MARKAKIKGRSAHHQTMAAPEPVLRLLKLLSL